MEMNIAVKKMFHRFYPGENRPADSALEKSANVMIAVATAVGILFFEEARASLATLGIPLSSFTTASFAGYAARLQWEKLSALGLIRLDKLVLHHTARIKEFLKKNPHITNTDDFLHLAFFHDMVAYMLRHFTPIRKLATPGMLEALINGNLVNPAPYSDAAVQCVGAVGRIPYATIKTRGIALEPVGIEDLLNEPSLTVNEAARVMRLAPKTLEDMCRDGRIPDSVYRRYAKTGSYHFPTTKLLAFMESGAHNPRKSR